jgi:hypothetical protein
MNDKWNAEQANQLLRAALAEIDELGINYHRREQRRC